MTHSKNDLIFEIGRLVLLDPEYSDADWDALSLVVSVGGGSDEYNGYIYIGDTWEGRAPWDNSSQLLDRATDLQDAMAAETGRRWKQALIHVTRPGPEIDIQFEYDDPTRWSLKKVSLDLADYAESLRPPRPGVAR